MRFLRRDDAREKDMKTHKTLSGLAFLACMATFGCSAQLATPARAAAPGAQMGDDGGSVCTIIDDKARVSDTRIAERWPDKNYGEGKAAFAGAVGDAARQTLLRFDLSSLPPGVEIMRATISLHKCVNGGAGVTAHQVLSNWNEHDVTWSSFGQAYEADPVVELPAVDPEPSTVSFDLTELAQAWVEGREPNHGVLLRQDDSNTAFATSEAEDPSDRPRLLICYRDRDESAPTVAVR
jgi:hypothetical protein